MKAPRLPPLNALRAFDLAGQCGSFVAAAEALHVTQPAIARQIRSLEQWLGQPLFERHARGVALTEAGRHYHERIHQALAAIHEATQDFSAQPDRAWIRLIAVPGFASRWLRPRLGAFLRAQPGLRIAVEPAAVLTELPVQRADLGVGYGEPDDFAGPTELLIRPPVFPVCAPALLARLGPPGSVRALLRWPLLHEDDGSWWAEWFGRLGVRARPLSDLAHASADDVMALALSG
ncbi:MAG: LysR family transcriptional regulator, partial [Burkholderiales bacterium]|nr:LysR family transcriptional regulator [Burkholderiales bacterium]